MSETSRARQPPRRHCADPARSRKKANDEIRVIPRFVPMSDEDAEEVARLIARLLVDFYKKEIRKSVVD